MVLNIAYLVNQYPAISHSFIRREIQGLEDLNYTVRRYSLRRVANLVSGEDRAEELKTKFVLENGAAVLAWAFISSFLRAPCHSWRALLLALAMGKKSGARLRSVVYFAEACWLLQEFQAEGIDHVHVHFGTNSAAVARLVRQLGGPPYSFTVHGPDEFDRPVALDLEGKVADSAAAIAISNYGRAQLMRWSRVSDWHKIAVVRCGVEKAFHALAAPSPPDELPRLVTIARLSPAKGLPLLVQAVRELARRDRNFHLTIIGEGPLRAELEASVASLGLSDLIAFAGACDADAIRQHLLAARALVLPSFAEGLPVVIMEALALGRPVIATAIAGIPELVDDQCGWLIPAGSTERLVGAMRLAIDADIATIIDKGKVGRERVLARHDAVTNAAMLADILRKAA